MSVVFVYRVVAILAALAASACSTTSSTTPEIPSDTRTGVYVQDAAARVTYRPDPWFDVPARLELAVIKAAANRPGGQIPVRLAMVVTRFELVDASTRLFHGVFAGWNKLHVMVDVIDTRTGTALGRYVVKHEESPDSDAAFGDQSRPLIDQAAAAVVDVLYRPGPLKLDVGGVPPP